MRTTVRLDGELLRRAKLQAVETRRTLTAVIEEALRHSLSRRHGPTRYPPLRIVPFKGTGTRSGINPIKTSGLFAAEDEEKFHARR